MSGVKIPYACDIVGNQITIVNFKSSGRPKPIFCGGKGCHAELQYVSASQRVNKSGVTQVPAYFRLAQHHNHATACSFLTRGSFVINAEVATNEVSKALANGTRSFRIHLMDAQDHSKMKKKENAFVQNHSHDSTKRTYSVRGNKTPHINNLNSLLELYEYGKNNPAEQRKIMIFIDKLKLSWDEFFYAQNRYHQLYNKILNTGNVKTAVIGTIKEIHFRSPTRKFASVEMYQSRDKVSPVARLRKSLNHRFITPGKKVLCFGSFNIEHNKKAQVNSMNSNHELVMFIAEKSQWLEY